MAMVSQTFKKYEWECQEIQKVGVKIYIGKMCKRFYNYIPGRGNNSLHIYMEVYKSENQICSKSRLKYVIIKKISRN